MYGTSGSITSILGAYHMSGVSMRWAAYVQDEDGHHQTWDQAELYEQLQAQSAANPDQIDLETAIEMMERAKEIQLPF